MKPEEVKKWAEDNWWDDHLEWLLDNHFNERWVTGQIGTEGSGGLWDQVRTAAFLEAVAPTVAVISVGADNRYRLPSPEVEARYRARGTCVLRTDRCGAVAVETDGTALAVTSHLGCRCP